MKHKWAKEAIAFFSGETVQLRDPNNPIDKFKDWDLPGVPPFDQKFYEFRIKPKEVVMYKWAYQDPDGRWQEVGHFAPNEDQIKAICQTFRAAFKRLDYTATPFEVEE